MKTKSRSTAHRYSKDKEKTSQLQNKTQQSISTLTFKRRMNMQFSAHCLA